MVGTIISTAMAAKTNPTIKFTFQIVEPGTGLNIYHLIWNDAKILIIKLLQKNVLIDVAALIGMQVSAR